MVLSFSLSFSSILLSIQQAAASTGDIYTVSGTGIGAYTGDGGQSAAAGLKNPAGISVDTPGNIYIADRGSQRIRKVGAAGNITTIAGNGTAGYTGDGGQAALASISNPSGICLDTLGDVFFADTDNCRVRKIDPSGIISTVAGNGRARYSGDGQSAVKASLKYSEGVAVDSLGNLYIADTGNNRIRKVNASGTITTVAGNGTAGFSGDGGLATQAGMNGPKSVAVDPYGNIYIADSGNNRVRKVNTSGIITTVAGNGVAGYAGDGGTAPAASLNNPTGVALDSAGNICIADFGNNAVRKVDPSGTIATVAGTGTPGFSGDGGPAKSAQLNNPYNAASDSYGNLFVTDNLNNRVRMLESASYPLPISAVTFPQSCGQVYVENLTVAGQASALNGVSFVEVSTDGGATWNTATGTDQWTYSWRPQAPGTYSVLSRANDSLNVKERLDACSVTTAVADTTPPASTITAPAQGAALTGASCTITGTATDGTGSGVAKVEVSVNGGTSWSTASGTTGWSYIWNLPATGGTYALMSRATDNSGNVEAPTALVSVTVTQPVTLQPVTINSPSPTPASATAGDAVTWTASASGGTGSYQYEFQREGPDTGGIFITVQNYGTSNSWTWATTTVMAGSNIITVNVKNSDGSGSAATASAPYSLSAPTTTATTTTASTNQAVLTWSPSTSTGVAGYKVYYGAASGTYTSSISVGNATTYTVSNLAAGTYYFATTAYDSTGHESGYSNQVSKSIAASGTPPPAPSNQAALTWNPSTSTGVAGYKVYYGAVSGSYTSSINVGNVSSYTVTNLSPGTYYFATTAYDSTGKESGYSNQVSKVIPVQATLTWNASTSAGVSGYKVYYGTASGVFTNSINAGNATTCALNGLTSGNIYYFATTAYDSTGKESGYSNQVSKAIP